MLTLEMYYAGVGPKTDPLRGGTADLATDSLLLLLKNKTPLIGRSLNGIAKNVNTLFC